MNNSLEALITRLKAAAEKAAPGPYSIDHTGYSLKCSDGTFGDFLDMDNATFALEANPESVLVMVAALEQAQTEREVLRTLSVPAGWKLVPTTATPSMVRAGAGAARKYMEETGGNSPYVIYEAMVLEAPAAGLEARQLTVKIPDRKADVFWPGDASEFDSLGYEMAVREAIRAAGGNVDA